MRLKLLNAIADHHSGDREEGERILDAVLDALEAPSEDMMRIGTAYGTSLGQNPSEVAVSIGNAWPAMLGIARKLP